MNCKINFWLGIKQPASVVLLSLILFKRNVLFARHVMHYLFEKATSLLLDVHTISFHIIINVRQLLANVACGICVFLRLLAPFSLVLHTRDLFYWACSMGTHALFAPYCVRSKSPTVLIAANLSLSQGGWLFGFVFSSWLFPEPSRPTLKY